MRDKVLEILKTEKKALALEDIDNLLGLTTPEEYSNLVEEVNEMENEGILYHTNKDKYMMMQESPYRKGILNMNKKGFGFVIIPDMDDVYVSEVNLNGALQGDEVLIEVFFDNFQEKYEGRVIKVTKRSLTTIVGEIKFKKDRGFVVSDDKKIKVTAVIKKELSLGAVDGHKVVVELLKRIDNTRFSGQVVKILGHRDDPGVDILSIVYKHNINDTFPEEVEEELKSIPTSVSESDKVGRVDLTNECIFTIDGDDTKDIDDAISIEKLENGNYKLGVHIADVSYYVKEGTALDVNAMDRGTSVYLVDRVIPMIPHQLSNGICSLNEGVERLAISCIMEIDNKSNIVNYDILETVIKSRKKMTYKNVNMILEHDKIPEGYEEFVDKLKMMAELASILRKAKLERGYLDFNADEAKVIVDEDGKPIDVVLRDRGVGENLIEDFMIIANECVASHIFYMELPFIYRIHELPDEDRIKSYLSYLQTIGYVYQGNMKDVSPKTVQKLLNFVKEKPEEKILSSLLLRSMKKAVYEPTNKGHYGLASPCYTHFTSPIRRYPDTTVHRLLRTYLFNHELDNKTLEHWQQKLIYIADNSSARERASIECEREVDEMKMAEYMENHIGEKFEGMISGITNFGIFIELDNLIEGLSRYQDMDDFYNYDEKSMTATGERTRKRYRIGDKVLVKVTKASKIDHTIDFEIISKLDIKDQEGIEII